MIDVLQIILSYMYRVLITGANRGLGKDVLKLILKNNANYQVVATARTGLNQLKQVMDKEFPQNHLHVAELDLFQKQSIHCFVQKLKESKLDFDCLINNAAYGCDYGFQVPSVQVATKTLMTNFVGTVDLTEQLLPLLKANGRIINVSSKMGGLRFHQKQIIEKYDNQNILLKQILHEVEIYIKGCEKGSVGSYYKSAYGTSKMMLNAWSRFILKKQLKNGQTVISMSPGHCKTDMGKQHALRTCLEGALTIYSHIHGQYSSDKFYHVGVQTNFMECG